MRKHIFAAQDIAGGAIECLNLRIEVESRDGCMPEALHSRADEAVFVRAGLLPALGLIASGVIDAGESFSDRVDVQHGDDKHRGDAGQNAPCPPPEGLPKTGV
ncbi:MAG: hypothetical protein QHI48_02110 [Bacteroidota bacterium]|nr:hypothetical protein [Bacteroidota bacterium]